MMFAKVFQEQVLEYPIVDIRAKFSNISFPAVIEDRHLPQGIVRVVEVPRPTVGYTQYVIEGTPLKNGSMWVQTWEVHNRTAEEISRFRANKATEVRNRRNFLLQETDWVITRAAETGTYAPASVLAYRAALRDVPSQPGFPLDVQWPDKP